MVNIQTRSLLTAFRRGSACDIQRGQDLTNNLITTEILSRPARTNNSVHAPHRHLKEGSSRASALLKENLRHHGRFCPNYDLGGGLFTGLWRGLPDRGAPIEQKKTQRKHPYSKDALAPFCDTSLVRQRRSSGVRRMESPLPSWRYLLVRVTAWGLGYTASCRFTGAGSAADVNWRHIPHFQPQQEKQHKVNGNTNTPKQIIPVNQLLNMLPWRYRNRSKH